MSCIFYPADSDTHQTPHDIALTNTSLIDALSTVLFEFGPISRGEGGVRVSAARYYCTAVAADLSRARTIYAREDTLSQCDSVAHNKTRGTL